MEINAVKMSEKNYRNWLSRSESYISKALDTKFGK